MGRAGVPVLVAYSPAISPGTISRSLLVETARRDVTGSPGFDRSRIQPDRSSDCQLGAKRLMKRTVAWLSEAYLPAKVDVALKHSGHFLMSWMNRRVPVTFWRGPMRASGRPATVLVGGDEPWANSLPARLFSRTPQRETLGGVPFWKLPRLLQRQRSFAD